jgi:hypothetical protein
MNNLDHYIDYLLELVLSEIEPISKNIDKVMFLKQSKNKYSSKGVAQKLEITTTAIDELEFRLKNYLDKKNDKILDETNALRLIISLEYIIKIKKIAKNKELVKDGKKEQDSVKHVRVLELIVRDIVYDQIGDNELLLVKLAEIFNDEVIKSWIKNADESGLLSGTSFNELSTIFLAQNLFLKYEYLFTKWSLNISKNVRETLRFAFEDIRVIRNQIAHNKLVTYAQIELLNIYYNELLKVINENSNSNLNINKYLLKEGLDNQLIISKMQADRRDYWHSFILYLNENEFNITGIIPSINHWLTLINGLITVNNHQSKIQINVLVNNNKKVISVELFIYNDESKTVFDFLYKNDFVASTLNIDANIKWDRLDDRKGSRIIHQMEGDFLDKEECEIQYSWLKVYLQRFILVFGKHFNSASPFIETATNNGLA